MSKTINSKKRHLSRRPYTHKRPYTQKRNKARTEKYPDLYSEYDDYTYDYTMDESYPDFVEEHNDAQSLKETANPTKYIKKIAKLKSCKKFIEDSPTFWKHELKRYEVKPYRNEAPIDDNFIKKYNECSSIEFPHWDSMNEETPYAAVYYYYCSLCDEYCCCRDDDYNHEFIYSDGWFKTRTEAVNNVLSKVDSIPYLVKNVDFFTDTEFRTVYMSRHSCMFIIDIRDPYYARFVIPRLLKRIQYLKEDFSLFLEGKQRFESLQKKIK